MLPAGAAGTSHASGGRPRHSNSSQSSVEPSSAASRGQRHSVTDVDEAVPTSSSRRSAFLEPLSRSSSAANDSNVSSPTLPSSATGATFSQLPLVLMIVIIAR